MFLNKELLFLINVLLVLVRYMLISFSIFSFSSVIAFKYSVSRLFVSGSEYIKFEGKDEKVK